jgi:hypothetical protein
MRGAVKTRMKAQWDFGIARLAFSLMKVLLKRKIHFEMVEIPA